MIIEKPKILWNAKDHPDIKSGYGIIGYHLLPRLAKAFGPENILIYAPVFERDRLSEWQDMTVLSGQEFSYGEGLVHEHYQHHRCNMLLQVGDAWPLGRLPDLSAAGQITWVQWLPVDWLGMPKNILNRIKPAFRIIPFAEYGEKALLKAGLTNVGSKIHLGIDPTIWKPQPRQELQKVMRLIGFEEDALNILFVGANQERKRIRQTLEAIQLFRLINPEVKIRLYMHTPLTGERDLNADFDELGLIDIVSSPDPYFWTRGGFPENEMAMIFNCADLVINVAMEGFGLAQVQAQACGVPVICLAEGAGPEIVKYGGAVSSFGKEVSAHQMAIPLPDTAMIAHLISIFDKDRREGKAPCRDLKVAEWARETFSWDKIAYQWEWVIDDIMERRAKGCVSTPSSSEALLDRCRNLKEVG
jgi:glycosyltransferase involved in cell wall biosynthesis